MGFRPHLIKGSSAKDQFLTGRRIRRSLRSLHPE
ncbi:hypothetical protein WP1_004 [Pseudomonas phage WP1]